jgi:CRISPR-associated exonuclease Cas4
MQDYLQISKLNDFIFCPRSIYMHNLYESFEKEIYQKRYQVRGSIKHETIEEEKYSSESRYLQALPVVCNKYQLIGKIDIFDVKNSVLIERKTKVQKIFDGYWLQLYAQKLSLEEMGYCVKQLKIHSLLDNKSYFLSRIEEKGVVEKFLDLMIVINSIQAEKLYLQNNTKKCLECIYRELCRGDL